SRVASGWRGGTTSSATAMSSTSDSMSSPTLGIVGVGLIGGSIGMAARRAGWEVSGVDTDGTLERAVDLGAIDHPSRLDDVRGAEMVVLAAPVSRITGLLAELAPTDALVTDVGSAKAAIVRAAAAAGIGRFVGGHPMAGSQLGGVANASPDLFRGARYLITPTGDTLPEAYARVTQFVRDDLGAIPTAVDPERHDRLPAALSPLPPPPSATSPASVPRIPPSGRTSWPRTRTPSMRCLAPSATPWAGSAATSTTAPPPSATSTRQAPPTKPSAASSSSRPGTTSTSRCRSRTGPECSPRSPPRWEP